MFNYELERWNNFDFPSFFSSVTKNDVMGVLEKEYLSDIDLLMLLSDSAENCLEEMAQLSQELTIKKFGRTVQLYTPLYLSNYCSNSCVYCGFNHSQKIKRTRLNFDEVREEAEKIHSTGLQHILVLTGGDRQQTDLDYILKCITILKNYFASISIEMYSMNDDEYSELINCGVNNVTIYQETYNHELYKIFHRSGEKADYNFRLNAPERAAKAGANSINFGALLGLEHPETDFFKASLHTDYLRKKYPGVNVAMSYPRIRPTIGGYQPDWKVTDKKLVKFITAYRLFMPQGEISISTRESASLRDRLLPLGTTKLSADSITSVGSRSRKERTEDQFEISDSRSVLEIDKTLRGKGYQPLYKDWDIL